MNLKKFATGLTLLMMMPAAAFAHGELWYDANSHLPQFKKIVVYPIKGTKGQFFLNDNEESLAYRANDFFNKRFVRKLKIKTIQLGSMLKENKEIRTDEDKYQSLYNNFSSEEQRAAAVYDVTGADGYIIAQIKEVRTEPHLSPEKTVTVQMRSWTEETGGPNGNVTYDERHWTERHTIPAKELMLYHMGIEYNMFDRTGKKIMTYRNAEHTYGEKYGGISGAITGLFGGRPTKSLRPDRYKVEMFKHIVNEFRKDYKDIQNKFNDKKKREAGTVTIGFKGINLPGNVGGDEYSLKSAYFSMKDLSYKYTDANIDYDGDGNARYFVSGSISNYSLNRTWIEPSASTYASLVSSQDVDWYDRAGKKHTKTIKRYVTGINDNFGYWDYKAVVSGTFNLTDGNGRTVVSHSATKTDDKTADAYRHLLKDFYQKVKSHFGDKK